MRISDLQQQLANVKLIHGDIAVVIWGSTGEEDECPYSAPSLSIIIEKAGSAEEGAPFLILE